jgi:hypothetical protein
VLAAIAEAVLPAEIIEAARRELRRRLDSPAAASVGRQRARLTKRLEQLPKQNEWGDLSDAGYLVKRDEVQAALAELPDGDRIRASTPTGQASCRYPTPSAPRHLFGERNSAGWWSIGSSSAISSFSPSRGRPPPDRSSRKDSGRAPKGIRTPDLHLERVAS